MFPDHHDLSFWVAILLAIIVKILTSPVQSVFRTITTMTAAIFAAWAFTDPVIHWTGAAPDVWTTPTAALLALTGENLVRKLIMWVDDPKQAFDLWKAWKEK